MSPAFLLLAGLKASILLGAALLFCTVVRRSSAAGKHLVCLSALAGALLIPVLMAVLPQWSPIPAIGAAAGYAGEGVPAWTLLVWLAGLALFAVRGARRWFTVRRVLALGREVRDARLLGMAIEARREIGTRVPIRVLIAPVFRVPMTTGIRRPAILLPENAHHWSTPRLRAILLHETAHLARRDALAGLVAGVACALWWFVPLSWLVARRLRLYREVACDDRVIERGGRRSGYAALLLDCFARFQSERPLAGAAVLGNRRELQRRVQSLVDDGTRRETPHRQALLVVLAAGMVTLALATTGRAAAPVTPNSVSRSNRIHIQCSVSVTKGVHAATGTTKR